MPYDPTDPRSQLAPAGSPTHAGDGVPRPATYRELGATPPDEHHRNSGRTWWTRSQAMEIAQTQAAPGEALATETSCEYVAILVDGATAMIEHGASGVRTAEPSVPGGTGSSRANLPLLDGDGQRVRGGPRPA